MVVDRRKSAEAVAAISQAQSAPLADQLTTQLGIDGALTLEAFLDKLAQALLGSRAKMVKADEAHQSELSDDPKARDARDAAARHLTSTLVSLRDVVTGLYGRETAARVFTEATPSDPVELQGFAAVVTGRLASTEFGASQVPGTSVDAAACAIQLERESNELAARLQDVAREVRETQATLVAKNAAIAEYDRAFTGIAKVFEGLFILAGQPEFASRVRPSRRRPGQTAESTTDEPVTE